VWNHNNIQLTLNLKLLTMLFIERKKNMKLLKSLLFI